MTSPMASISLRVSFSLGFIRWESVSIKVFAPVYKNRRICVETGEEWAFSLFSKNGEETMKIANSACQTKNCSIAVLFCLFFKKNPIRSLVYCEYLTCICLSWLRSSLPTFAFHISYLPGWHNLFHVAWCVFERTIRCFSRLLAKRIDGGIDNYCIASVVKIILTIIIAAFIWRFIPMKAQSALQHFVGYFARLFIWRKLRTVHNSIMKNSVIPITEQCVGTVRRGLRFIVLIREDFKV